MGKILTDLTAQRQRRVSVQFVERQSSAYQHPRANIFHDGDLLLPRQQVRQVKTHLRRKGLLQPKMFGKFTLQPGDMRRALDDASLPPLDKEMAITTVNTLMQESRRLTGLSQAQAHIRQVLDKAPELAPELVPLHERLEQESRLPQHRVDALHADDKQAAVECHALLEDMEKMAVDEPSAWLTPKIDPDETRCG